MVWLWWCGIRMQAEALVPQPAYSTTFDFITVYFLIQIISMFFKTQAAQRNYPAVKFLQQ